MSAPSTLPASGRPRPEHIDAKFPLFPLLVITGAIFVSVTSEFLPTGLLPAMAADVGVSESRIGLLVTAFAATVVFTTFPLAALTRKLSRKRLMVGLLLGFGISNLVAAVAPTYEILLGARILGGALHGLFWAVTGPYASHLVPRHQLAKAVAVTNIGATAAFVAGIPVGTALGNALGWRLSFMIMAAVVLIFTVLVVLYLPPVSHRVPVPDGEPRSRVLDDPSLPVVVMLCLTVILFATAHNSFYTYIAPWLIQVAGFSADAVGPMLFAYGAAGAIGLVLTGVLGDRFSRQWLMVVMIGTAATAIGLGLLAGVGWAVIPLVLLWGMCFSGFPPVVHARLLKAASRRVRDLASASLTTSFNLAIGGGALIGGLLLDHLGIGSLPWAVVGLAALAIGYVVVSDRGPVDAK